MPSRSPDTPAVHRHAKNPIGIGKSAAHDAHDAHDDELQGFSNGGGALCCEVEEWCDESAAWGAQARRSPSL
jgi:hypothetical protein